VRLSRPGSGYIRHLERERPLELARHYLDIGRPERALEALGRADVDLEDPEIWALRAHAQLELRHGMEAADAAREGLARDPEDISVLETLALAELGLARYDEADRTIQRALELWPDHPGLLAQRALILARAKRNAEARKLIDEAVRLDPYDAHLLRIRAQVDVLSEDRERAQQSVDALLAVAPDDSLGLALRGSLVAGDKQWHAAARHFEEAARLDPTDENIAHAARESRVMTHPLLAPVRPMWRLGRWRSWLLYLAIITTLGALRLGTLRVAVVCVWLVIVALSWLGPPLLRRRQRRRYGR
jgi:tetratricopeptide (TPR) repeat protein